MEETTNKIEDILKMYKYLFPNEELHQNLVNFNNSVAKKIIASFIVWPLLSSFLVLLAVFYFEGKGYITSTIIMYVTFIIMGLNVFIVLKPRIDIFKKQYQELILDKELYKYEIILHKNYKKYNLIWNIIYLIVLALAIYVSVSLFVNDLIASGDTSLGPIFAFLIVSLVLFLPVLVLNFIFFKRFRNKQRTTEEKIKKAANID